MFKPIINNLIQYQHKYKLPNLDKILGPILFYFKYAKDISEIVKSTIKIDKDLEVDEQTLFYMQMEAFKNFDHTQLYLQIGSFQLRSSCYKQFSVSLLKASVAMD